MDKQEKKLDKKSDVSDSPQIAIHKKFNGIVLGDGMNKTIVVEVDRVKIHSKYKKRFTVSKKYKVHDEKEQFKTGDKVSFIECRPLSKDKRWRVIYK